MTNFEILKEYNSFNGDFLYAQNDQLYVTDSFRGKIWVIIYDLLSFGGITKQTQKIYEKTIRENSMEASPFEIGEEAFKNWFISHSKRIETLGQIRKKPIYIHFFSQVREIQDEETIEISMKKILLNDLKQLNCGVDCQTRWTLTTICDTYERVMKTYNYNFERQENGQLKRIRTGPWRRIDEPQLIKTQSIPPTEFYSTQIELTLPVLSYVRTGLDKNLDADLTLLRVTLESIPRSKRVPISLQFEKPFHLFSVEDEEKARAIEVVKKLLRFWTVTRPCLCMIFFCLRHLKNKEFLEKKEFALLVISEINPVRC